ncbi:MAG: tryptophan--tRNA ligase [Polyangiales bacterium]|nr:tryptophan--tRNA ligase [Myxococcales bacterium]
MKTSLTGIKPTGTPHLGNYLGAIRPGLALAREFRTFYFIADYHALTTERDPMRLRSEVYDVAATWIACGLDPNKTLLYRQSDIIEVFELAWVFACLLATGQLERGHAYKDAVARGDAPNAGIFNYPVLMAADIVLYDADVVPVGRDQVQHIELCRDVATRLNHIYGEGTVVVPDVHLASVPTIPGTDGEKMSKSRGNSIPLFAPAKDLRKAILGIKTGSETLEEPKNAEGTTVFEIYRSIATDEQCASLKARLQAGGFGWGHAKQELFELLDAEIGPMREKYNALRADEAHLDMVLADGATRARTIAHQTITRVREAIGIQRTAGRDSRHTIPLK